MSNSIQDVIKGRAPKAKAAASSEGSSTPVALEVGDQFLGRLTGTFEFNSKFGDYVVQGWEFDVNGEPHSITHKGNLKYEIARSGAEVGDDVLIERMPDEKTKNGRMASTFSVTAYPA